MIVRKMQKSVRRRLDSESLCLMLVRLSLLYFVKLSCTINLATTFQLVLMFTRGDPRDEYKKELDCTIEDASLLLNNDREDKETICAYTMHYIYHLYTFKQKEEVLSLDLFEKLIIHSLVVSFIESFMLCRVKVT